MSANLPTHRDDRDRLTPVARFMAFGTPAPTAARPLTGQLAKSARALEILSRAVAELEALQETEPCAVGGCGANLAGFSDPARETHMRTHGLRRWLR